MRTSIQLTIIFAVGLSISANVLAQSKYRTNGEWPTVAGEVQSVNPASATFQIKDQNSLVMTFLINAATKIEDHRTGQSFGPIVKFSDLKRGQWGQVTYYGTGEAKVARNIAILDYPTGTSLLDLMPASVFGSRSTLFAGEWS